MVGRGQVRLCRAEASEVIKEKKMGNSSTEKPELRCNQSHSTRTLGKTSHPATVMCVTLFLHQLSLYPLAHTFLSKWADRMTQLVSAQPLGTCPLRAGACRRAHPSGHNQYLHWAASGLRTGVCHTGAPVSQGPELGHPCLHQQPNRG